MDLNNLKKYKRILIITIATISLAIIAYLLWYYFYYLNLPSVRLTFAPSSIVGTAEDGTRFRNGINHVKAGKYKVEFKKDGFKTIVKEFEITLEDNNDIEFFLESDSEETKDYYRKNTADAEIVEGIAGRQFARQQKDYLNKYPILKDLPALGQNFTVQSDISVPQGKPTLVVIVSDTGMPSEEVRQTYRNEALTWLKSRGVEPSQYYIRYVN